jgi:hypothetical protein
MTEIQLNPGEIICPECNGSGNNIFEQSDLWNAISQCSKCLGSGKLDWIERIVGKPRNWIEIDLSQEILRELSENLAAEIDRQILETVHKEAEQIQKEEIDDNGIVSKLLLYPSS